jgi:K+-transporting ATPase ATPase C chain
MLSQIRISVTLLALFTLILGIAYPLAITGIAQLLFSDQANGSLIQENGQVFGSSLVGQPFDSPRYFWSRPSASTAFPYNASASGGSNLSPSSPVLHQAVLERIRMLQAADPGNTASIPVDLVTSSSSGLDPHISLAAALYQIPRIARARSLSEGVVRELVEQHTTPRFLGLFGEQVVNVLELNLALDRLQ